MLKKALAKAAAGTLVGGGLLIPAAVVGGTELALTTCPSKYPAATTTTVAINLPAVSDSDNIESGTATVSGATVANGTLSVYRYEDHTSSPSSPSGGTLVNGGDLNVTNTDRTVNFTVNNTGQGGDSDIFRAFYVTSSCAVQDSMSPTKAMSVLYFTTVDNVVTSVDGSKRFYRATVTGDPAGKPFPNGLKIRFYFDNDGTAGPPVDEVYAEQSASRSNGNRTLTATYDTDKPLLRVVFEGVPSEYAGSQDTTW